MIKSAPGKASFPALQQEVSKYAKFELALQQLTKRKELVDRKRQIIKDLQNDRDAVVRMLALLSIQVPPEKMWFDKLAQTGNSVTLEGVAQSNEAIVEFMRNLESSPYIEKGSINLVQSRQFAVKEMKLREFQLTYRFYPLFRSTEKVEDVAAMKNISLLHRYCIPGKTLRPYHRAEGAALRGHCAGHGGCLLLSEVRGPVGYA